MNKEILLEDYLKAEEKAYEIWHSEIAKFVEKFHHYHSIDDRSIAHTKSIQELIVDELYKMGYGRQDEKTQEYMKSFVGWLNKSFEDEIKWAEEEANKSNSDTRKAYYEGRIESAKEWLETLKHLAWDDEGDDDKC